MLRTFCALLCLIALAEATRIGHISRHAQERSASVTSLFNVKPKTPYCADTSECLSWVTNHCGKEWADRMCPLSCGTCELCTLGEWGEWEACSSECGGGGQTRTRSSDCTQGPITESRQCNEHACRVDSCVLKESGPIVVKDDPGRVIENLTIITTGCDPAISIENSPNSKIRNVVIMHAGCAGRSNQNGKSGPGIFFKASANIHIENVKVELKRLNPYVSAGVCADEMCGPFPKDMKYAYNIQGWDSPKPTVRNVHVIGGSSGFHCQKCEGGIVSHFKAENMHGPYPRGQCLQVTYSDGFTLEDFYCFNDNELAFTEDSISIWKSPNSLVQRGLVDGGNGPNGVGVMFEMSSHSRLVDVDATNVGSGSFSAYGADNVTFLRTRARDNHGPSRQCDVGRGFCTDLEGGNQCCETGTCKGEKRLDPNGGIWFAGDYGQQFKEHAGKKASNIRIQQGMFYNMAYFDEGKCKEQNLNTWAVSAANRQVAYIQKDITKEDFALRRPFAPSFCWEGMVVSKLTQ